MTLAMTGHNIIMTKTFFSRRHFISSMAAATGMSLMPFSSSLARAGNIPSDEWRKPLLGSELHIRLPESVPGAQLNRVGAEIEALARAVDPEKPDSDLARLNQEGHLRNPSIVLRDMLHEARHFFEVTDGVFCPITGAVARVRFSGMSISDHLIVLDREAGVAVDLGGLAHGFMVDRTAELLEAQGISAYTITLGNITSSRLAPQGGKAHRHSVALIDESNAGQVVHPRTNHLAHNYQMVKVSAQTAAAADALATAFSLMDNGQISKTLVRVGQGTVQLVNRQSSASRIAVS